MKRERVGRGGFAERRPQTNFMLDRELLQSLLPDDSPPSLVMLSLQCCEYEPGSRPFADDVFGEIYLTLLPLPIDAAHLSRRLVVGFI
jgi:hypothetical protein